MVGMTHKDQLAAPDVAIQLWMVERMISERMSAAPTAATDPPGLQRAGALVLANPGQFLHTNLCTAENSTAPGYLYYAFPFHPFRPHVLVCKTHGILLKKNCDVVFCPKKNKAFFYPAYPAKVRKPSNSNGSQACFYPAKKNGIPP
jgi:hypothetical protein